MLICPKCKILYEKSTNCIRCGSPLVEKASSEKEELTTFPQPEIKKKTLSVQKAEGRKDEPKVVRPSETKKKPPPIPTPKLKKEEPETGSLTKTEKASREVLRDKQRSLDRLPSETKKKVSRSGEIQIKIPTLSYQKIGIIILILIGGYFLWSIYSYFTPKKTETSLPPEETASLLPTRPSAPVSKPKVTDHKGPEKSLPVDEKRPSVSPSTSSISTASKTPVSDKKEIEHIKTLFENIRQANLQKNVDLFMSCYSMSFKDREGKKKETIKNFENFTFTDLFYNMRKHSISGDTALVRIEWLIRFSPKRGGQSKESKTVMDVTLNREPDGWKIKNIKTVS